MSGRKRGQPDEGVPPLTTRAKRKQADQTDGGSGAKKSKTPNASKPAREAVKPGNGKGKSAADKRSKKGDPEEIVKKNNTGGKNKRTKKTETSEDNDKGPSESEEAPEEPRKPAPAKKKAQLSSSAKKNNEKDVPMQTDDVDTESRANGSSEDEGPGPAEETIREPKKRRNDAGIEFNIDFDFLDDDDLAEIDDAVTGGDASVPGPLNAMLQGIWDAFLKKLAEFVVLFAKKSGKSAYVLWRWIGETFKLTREPNLFNMWVKRWSLINGMLDDETKKEYHRRYVDAYHDELDAATPERRQEIRNELLEFLTEYEKECAKELEDSGDGHKAVADARRDFARMAKHYGNKHSMVIVGLVLSTKYDAKMISASGAFASSGRVIPALAGLGVNLEELGGELAALFGGERVANRLDGDWSDSALKQVLVKSEGDRRYHLRLALLEIQNQVLKAAITTLKWKGNASASIARGFWVDNWPLGVHTPDIMGDNKYPEAMHNTLMDAAYKSLRKEPDFPWIVFVPFTQEQLDLRTSDWKAWCNLPAYRDTAGNTLIRVGDVMPPEIVDKKSRGRSTGIRFTGVVSDVPPENRATSAKVEGTDNADKLTAPIKRRRDDDDDEFLNLVGGGKRQREGSNEMDIEGFGSLGGMAPFNGAAQGNASNMTDLQLLQQQLMANQRQQFAQQERMILALMQNVLGGGAMGGAMHGAMGGAMGGAMHGAMHGAMGGAMGGAMHGAMGGGAMGHVDQQQQNLNMMLLQAMNARGSGQLQQNPPLPTAPLQDGMLNEVDVFDLNGLIPDGRGGLAPAT